MSALIVIIFVLAQNGSSLALLDHLCVVLFELHFSVAVVKKRAILFFESLLSFLVKAFLDLADAVLVLARAL